MISPAGWLTIYCALVLLASLAGGWLPLLVHLTHTRLQIAISLVAGLMLGIALLHFLPDAVEQSHSLDRTMAWVLGGFLTMFFLQRFFHFHHHDLPEGDPEDCCHHEHAPAGDPGSDHHAHTLADKSAKQLSWVGTALGLTLHSLLDGLALAAAVEAGAKVHAGLAGVGVALAVILHKPFDALAVSTLMTASGSSRLFRQVLNGLFALATPLGMALFYFGREPFCRYQRGLSRRRTGLLRRNIPLHRLQRPPAQLQFHSHDRFKLSLALLAGLGVAVLIGQIEASVPNQAHLANPSEIHGSN